MTTAVRVSEKALQQTIVDAARRLKWKVYHTYDSRRSTPGFPDLCMVRDDRLIFAELKTEKNKLTPEQEAWLEALSDFPGVETYVWRPSGLDDALRLLQGV